MEIKLIGQQTNKMINLYYNSNSNNKSNIVRIEFIININNYFFDFSTSCTIRYNRIFE